MHFRLDTPFRYKCFFHRQATFLTGVSPSLRGHIKLKNIYTKIHQLLQKIPKDSAYRINTEAVIYHRLSVINEAGDDIKEIEDKILCGKIEMLISQAEAEYNLMHNMLVWRPWEPLVDRPPQGQWDWPPAKI